MVFLRLEKLNVSSTQEVVEQEEVQDDAAFTAGFAEARGDEPPAEVVTEEVQEQQEEPPVVEEQVQNLIAGLTEAQIKDLFIKAGEVDGLKDRIEKLYGKHGEVNRTLQQLQSREQGEAVEITAEDVADIAAEYPELADLQLKALQKIAGKLRTGGATQQPQVDIEALRNEIRSEVVSESDRKLEERLIRLKHRDFTETVQSQDFTLWMQNNLKPEEQQQLVSSTDADYIIDQLDAFKSWRDQSAKQNKQKQNRLEAAITPKGNTNGPSTINDDDAFASGFNSIRASRL